jgi:hypothetical protein
MSDLTEDQARCYCQMERFSPSKNPMDSSPAQGLLTLRIPKTPAVWYIGTRLELGCTSFSHPPNFRGHNSEKCGTGPELLNDHRWERMRLYIVMLRRPKAGGDVVCDVASADREYACLLPGNFRDKEEFYRVFFSDFPI